MVINNPDIKVVEARYYERPFFIGVGTSIQRELKVAGELGTEGGKGEYHTQKDLDWQYFYNLKALPEGFMPLNELKHFMAGTVSVTSGSANVYSAETKFLETDPVILKKMILSPDVITKIIAGEHGYRIVTEGIVQRLEKIEEPTIDSEKILKKKKT
jgi:hypothetical protein